MKAQRSRGTIWIWVAIAVTLVAPTFYALGTQTTHSIDATLQGSLPLGEVTPHPTGTREIVPQAHPHTVYGAGVVNGTLVMGNNTYLKGNFQATQGLSPMSPTYDPATGDIYLADYDSQNLTVLDPTTNVAVANFPTSFGIYNGVNPQAIAYDPGNHDLYVAISGSTTVLVWNPVNHSGAALVNVGTTPDAIAYDPLDGDLYIADSGSNAVTILNGSTNTIVATVAVGTGPDGVAVDSTNGNVYVPSYSSANISVISSSSHTVISTVHLQTALDYPSAACFDPVDGHVFVTDGPSNNVTVIDGATNTLVTNISIAPYLASTDATACTFDPANGEVYVTEGANSLVLYLNPTTDSVVGNLTVGFNPSGAGFDPVNQDIYVTNEMDGNVSVIASSTNRVIANPRLLTEPWGVAFDPVSQSVFSSDPFALVQPGTVYDTNALTNSVSSTTLVAPMGGGPFSPEAIAYDPANNYIYAAASYTNSATGGTYGTVSVLNGANGALVTDLGSFIPYCLGYDSSNQEMYVGGQGLSGPILVGYSSSDIQVSVLSLASDPQALAYDPVNGDFYVSAGGSGQTSEIFVVNATTNSTVATIPTADATNGIAFDSWNHEIYETDIFNGISAVNTTSDRIITNISVASVAAGGVPYKDVFDPANGDIYATLFGGSSVAVINGTTNTLVNNIQVGQSPLGIATNASGTMLYVSDYLAGSLSMISLTTPNGPKVSSVTVSPPAPTFAVKTAVNLTANPVCTGGPCPSGIVYAWTLNNSLGTLNVTTGSSVAFTAGPLAGSTNVSVTASLNGGTATSFAILTITSSAVPILTSVSVSLSSTSVAPNGTVTATATPVCTGGSATCPAGTTFAWSLNNTRGSLSVTTGATVTFKAGPKTGVTQIQVKGSLVGHSAQGSASVTITNNPGGGTGPSGSGIPLWAWLVAGLVGAVVVVGAVFFLKFRPRARKPSSPPAAVYHPSAAPTQSPEVIWHPSAPPTAPPPSGGVPPPPPPPPPPPA